ncbi:hypothetical protein CryarDRAFT_3236 [Cryptosporangium arvum DSM 44712]|uniref:DUF4184 family protein n=1 Tax=Cryptosporangium arvum DSM 44712 TaxID=927661 RepID=A0A010ZY04_9ACTN|nr:hypothetical protein CryarDRAFT_3236 [Cryptosporangium arvum DSM 44712]
MFWLDPLLALALLVVFHVLLKRPAVALMPPAAAGRAWPPAERFVWRRATAVWWIAVSLMIGAATHLAWDRLDSALGENQSTKVDLASGVLGLAVLLVWLWRWWRITPAQPIPAALRLPARLRTVVRAALVAAPLVLGTIAAVGGVRELVAANQVDHSDLPPHIVPPTFTGIDMAELAVRRFATGRRGATGAGPDDGAT